MNRTIVTVLFFAVGSLLTVVSQDLDLMPKAKRDSILIAKAKEVILKYGPKYYREYKEPEIKREQFPPKSKINPTGENADRIYYEIIYYYDKTKERLGYDYAACVMIWADNGGELENVFFGNGVGRIISKIKLDSPDEITQVPYQQMVVPIYDVNNPQRPKNYDELIRKGYVDRGDGQWRKTSPDVPPAEVLEVLKREGYEEKNGRWIQVRPAESSLELKK